jgi:hypothetical protein
MIINILGGERGSVTGFQESVSGVAQKKFCECPRWGRRLGGNEVFAYSQKQKQHLKNNDK